MTETRPTIARKVTRKSEQNRQEVMDAGVRFTIPDDGTYEVRYGDITPALAREIRRETGYSFQQLMQNIVNDADLDVVATVVWISRHIQGEDVELDSIELNYATLLDDGFKVAPAEPEATDGAASPEA